MNIARIVTGSVADRVEPKIKHSSRPSWRDSRPRREYKYTSTPSPTADINVPINAKVKIVPKFRKKLSYVVTWDERISIRGSRVRYAPV